jgi:hypothetical protein
MEHGIEGHLSKPRLEGMSMNILTGMGEVGWDLNSAYSEALTMHSHLVFGREKSQPSRGAIAAG